MKVNLSELVQDKIIDQQAADRIKSYYKDRDSNSPNFQVLAFSILGALLVGLGIILMIAHNWDQFSTSTKAAIAFVPLIIGQVACGFSLTKKFKDKSWKEASSTFLYFALGGCMALISQIYNIPGDMASFLKVWMLLMLPVIFIMESSMASLLVLIGITFYGIETGYTQNDIHPPLLYLPVLAAVVTFFIWQTRKYKKGNFLTFHKWLIPLSIAIVFGTFVLEDGEWIIVAYALLLSLLMQIGKLDVIWSPKLRNNGFYIIGFVGVIYICFLLTFHTIWSELDLSIPSFPFYASLVLLALGIGLFALSQKSIIDLNLWEYLAFIIPVIALVGSYSVLTATIIMNVIVLLLGVYIVRKGHDEDHLGLINLGLAVIGILILCRFFDTNMSFVLRGILFAAVGIGFFAMNYWMIKKRSND